jgi:hypothetical protein
MVYIDMPLAEITEDVARDALAGRVAHLSPSTALALIARGDVPGLDALNTLRNATGDRDLDAVVRAGAIRTYARVSGADSVAVLGGLLGSDEERVAVAAATVLGQAGAPDHLPALRDLRGRLGHDTMRRRVAFAEALIVHRHGLADDEAPLPEPETVEEPLAFTGGRPFASTRPGLDRKRRALWSIQRDFPDLDMARQDVYEIQCGPRLMAVAVDGEAVGDSAARLRRGPAMPAVIALQDPEYGEYSTAFVLLSRPTGGAAVDARVHRLGSGEALYTGAGRVGNRTTSIDLRTSSLPGVVPMEARVRVTAAGVEISGTSQDRVLASRHPERLD